MFGTYKNIWLCGLAASGKTTILKLLSQKLSDVEFLNDSFEMLEFIRADKEEKHHSKPTPNTFLLKDSEPVYYSVAQIIAKAQGSKKKKIIELSRGSDTKETIDFSYKYFFSQLNEELKKSSLFIYIYAPQEHRLVRNEQRKRLTKNHENVFTSFHCPPEAMSRFFASDDFLEAVKHTPVDILFIPNVYSLEHLKNKVLSLFSSDTHLE